MKKYLVIILYLFLASCQTTQNKNKNCIGQLVNEKRDGLWVCKTPQQETIEINYLAGLKNGRMKIRHKDGHIMTESDWKNDIIDGDMLTYFPNGKTEIYSQMKNGKITGLNKEWDKDGNLLSECSYIDGIREGKCNTWYSNGKPESSAFYKKNLIDGSYKDWYESGVKRSEVLYKDGVILKSKYWTADGQKTKEVLEPYF